MLGTQSFEFFVKTTLFDSTLLITRQLGSFLKIEYKHVLVWKLYFNDNGRTLALSRKHEPPLL